MVEAGAYEIAQQMVAAIPKLIVILMIIGFVLIPVSCYINREVDVSNVKAMLASRLLVDCVSKYGLVEEDIKKCFVSDEYVFKINNETSLVYNDEFRYKLFSEDFNTKFYVRRKFSKVIDKKLVRFDLIFKK